MDNFGIPVSLTYKGDPQIKSVIGGTSTILARIMVIAYFVFQSKNVIERDYQLQTSVTKRDLSTDNETVHLNSSNFDFGIRLEYLFNNNEPQVEKNLDQYVFLSVTQNIYTWVLDSDGKGTVFNKTKIMTEMELCQQGRLGTNKNQKDYLGVNDLYLCPKNFSYQI